MAKAKGAKGPEWEEQKQVMRALMLTDWIKEWYRDNYTPQGREHYKKRTHTPVASFLVSQVWPITRGATETLEAFQERQRQYERGGKASCFAPDDPDDVRERIADDYVSHWYVRPFPR